VRLALPGMIVTILPPSLDGTVYAHLNPAYGYLPAGSASDVLHAYLTWFGPLVEKGVTPGMRTEVALATLVVFVFVHAHTRRLLRGLLGALLAYTVIFVWLAVPVLLELSVQWLGTSWQRSEGSATRLFALLCTVLVITAFARHDPGLVRTLWRDTRWLRLLHYELMLVLGMCLAHAAGAQAPDADYLFRVLLAGAAVALAWTFAVMNNNVFDLELDRINAPDRPLVTGAVDPARYVRLSWVVLAMALGLALTIHAAAAVLIAIFCCGYFTYSSPPLRLKENCGVSKFVIGLNSVACMTLGAGLASGLLRAPVALSWAVFVWFSLGAHMIDLKDVEGDRSGGIRTLATMLGRERAQRVIGSGALLAHLVAAFFLRDSWLALPVAAVGLLQAWVVMRSPYREAPVLWLQNLVSLAVIVRVLS